MLGLLSTSKDACVTFHKQGCLGCFPQARMLGLLCVCVRDAEGGETTPSFGHPSNVRRGKAGTAFGAERSEVPKGLLSNLPREVQHAVQGACPYYLNNSTKLRISNLCCVCKIYLASLYFIHFSNSTA